MVELKQCEMCMDTSDSGQCGVEKKYVLIETIQTFQESFLNCDQKVVTLDQLKKYAELAKEEKHYDEEEVLDFYLDYSEHNNNITYDEIILESVSLSPLFALTSIINGAMNNRVTLENI